MTRPRVFAPIIAGALVLAAAVAWGMRVRALRAEAVEIAVRAFEREFGRPPRGPGGTIPGFLAYAEVRWDAAKDAYRVDFVDQYVDADTPSSYLRGPVPFTSHTSITSFEVKGGKAAYLGFRAGGAY